MLFVLLGLESLNLKQAVLTAVMKKHILGGIGGG